MPVEIRWDLLQNVHHPVVGIRQDAVLDTGHGIVEFFEGRADFFAVGVDLVAVVDPVDGGDDHGAAATHPRWAHLW